MFPYLKEYNVRLIEFNVKALCDSRMDNAIEIQCCYYVILKYIYDLPVLSICIPS